MERLTMGEIRARHHDIYIEVIDLLIDEGPLVYSRILAALPARPGLCAAISLLMQDGIVDLFPSDVSGLMAYGLVAGDQ